MCYIECIYFIIICLLYRLLFHIINLSNHSDVKGQITIVECKCIILNLKVMCDNSLI